MDSIDKLLARIPKKHRRQIFQALDCLSDIECRETLRAEKLGGTTAMYRIRVGRYRIIFHTDYDNHAIVDDIRPRNESTYRNI